MVDFRKLIIWKKSVGIIKDVYKLCNSLPTNERFGIKDQIRRACISISTNIAEGANRASDKEFRRFLAISFASACEVESLLYVVVELEMVREHDINQVILDVREVQRMISGLRKKL